MSITLNITPETLDQLTWEQWELFDTISEKPNYHLAREIMSLFVEGMVKEAAMKELGQLKTSQMKDVFEQFAKKITEVGAVNPTKGGS
jgi:hypothetical protein